ncbi:hypothetical protein [Anoxybacillus sp. ST4]|nr:hypothetical protein [Anoxybacillus sp. ST4]MBW7650704.1 hypothetical protein [Anoxybacillus sp. ST4]
MKKWKDRSLIFRTAFLLSSIVAVVTISIVSLLLYQTLSVEKQLTEKYV